MSGAIASLLGALVGGLAAIGGAWLQAGSTAKLQREEAARAGKSCSGRKNGRRSCKIDGGSSRADTCSNWEMPSTPFSTGLTTGRIAAGSNFPKEDFPVTEK